MVLPACSPLIHHHHEQVTKGPQQLAPPLPSPQRPTMTVHVPKGKIVKMCNKHPNTEVTLDGKELWDEFYRRGTEMIVNRAGRYANTVCQAPMLLNHVNLWMTHWLSLPNWACVWKSFRNCCKQNVYSCTMSRHQMVDLSSRLLPVAMRLLCTGECFLVSVPVSLGLNLRPSIPWSWRSF